MPAGGEDRGSTPTAPSPNSTILGWRSWPQYLCGFVFHGSHHVSTLFADSIQVYHLHKGLEDEFNLEGGFEPDMVLSRTRCPE